MCMPVLYQLIYNILGFLCLQVLEWDGSSLEDATYEEARQIMDKSGDTVQLVVMHKK